MIALKRLLYPIFTGLMLFFAYSKSMATHDIFQEDIRPAAWRMDQYLPMLQQQRVALLVNQTSEINGTLLPDTLLKRGIQVVKIFVPEHGFRGTADAGATIKDGKDKTTGLPVVSLYGKNKKPTAAQLADVDIIVYDLQDVGARFYTYISSLEYTMQACAENNKKLLILDRPNPNGHYVDGPVLEQSSRSFVGMQPIPVVYGMTPGEYATMLVGEQWITAANKLDMTIIRCAGYNHTSEYILPVPPSPNLKTNHAIYQYPALCFFEGTVISMGRGTDHPFEQWGHPLFREQSSYAFTPQSRVGAGKPPFENQTCYGERIADTGRPQVLLLDRLIQAYQWFPNKEQFFIPFFETLAGTGLLRKQIKQGMSATAIRDSWQKDITAFKAIRKKYLLYPDFE